MLLADQKITTSTNALLVRKVLRGRSCLSEPSMHLQWKASQVILDAEGEY